jgi:threonine dehydrogenase-like Zn-dependent dehydrogenase
MSPSATEIFPSAVERPSKANIGVYTNPEHKLWVAAAEPSLESVEKGDSLKPGEVTVGIKSTGICGYDKKTVNEIESLLRTLLDPMSTSGMLVALVL